MSVDAGAGKSIVGRMAAAALLLAVYSSPGHAQVYVDAPEVQSPPPETIEPGLKYFVGDQLSIDDNLFRLPNGYTNLQTGSTIAVRADRVNELSAGGSDYWVNELQNLAFNLQLNHDAYDRNSYLDNTSGHGNITWNWSLASRWSGQLSADHSRAIVNFANTRIFEKDLLDTSGYFGSARYQVGPRWALTAEAARAETSHSLEAEDTQDSHVSSGAFGLEYATSADNTLELQYKYDSASFPDEMTTASAISGDFHESITRMLLQYQPSDKTLVTANAGYLSRSFVDSRLSKYSGDVWHGSLKWQALGKLELIASVGRDLAAYNSAASEYFIDQGRSVSVIWTARESLSISLLASHDAQNYIPGSQESMVDFRRRDTINEQKLAATYLPRDWLTLMGSVGREQRSSNDAYFPFNDRLIQLSFRVTL